MSDEIEYDSYEPAETKAEPKKVDEASSKPEKPVEKVEKVEKTEKPAFDAELAGRLDRLEKALTALAPKEEKQEEEIDYRSELEKKNAELTNTRVELAIIKAAEAAGINASAALDSSTVRKAVSEINLSNTGKVIETLKNLAEKDSFEWLRSSKHNVPPRATATGAVTRKEQRYTKNDFTKMTFNERVALMTENPQEYKRLLAL